MIPKIREPTAVDVEKQRRAGKFSVCWAIAWLLFVTFSQVVQAVKFGFSPLAAFPEPFLYELMYAASYFMLAIFLGICAQALYVLAESFTKRTQTRWILGCVLAVFLCHTDNSASNAPLSVLIFAVEALASTLASLGFVAEKKTSSIRETYYFHVILVVGLAGCLYFLAVPPAYYRGLWIDYASLNKQKAFVMASFDDNGIGHLKVETYAVTLATKKATLRKVYVGDIRWNGSDRKLVLYKTSV